MPRYTRVLLILVILLTVAPMAHAASTGPKTPTTTIGASSDQKQPVKPSKASTQPNPATPKTTAPPSTPIPAAAALSIKRIYAESHFLRVVIGSRAGSPLTPGTFNGMRLKLSAPALAITADLRLTRVKSLSVDEAMLTGDIRDKAAVDRAMEGIDEEMMNKTLESRTMVKTMMSHTLASTENNKPARYIVVNSMKPHEGKWNDYVAFERDVIKPLFEARIEQGALASWGLWQTYPYEQDDVRLVTVDGFESAEQMFMNWNFRENFEAAHPDRDWNESYQEMSQLRTMESVEIWELVDSVWPEH